MALSDLIRSSEGLSVLQRSLEKGRLSHAYLIHGPNPGFLETVAGNLAGILNCSNPVKSAAEGNAIDCCDQCESCLMTQQGSHPDIQYVRPESKLRRISIHKVRELMRTVYLKPLQGGYKISILSDADRLGTEAANAFLKTLEEPPEKSLLILTTTDPGKVLETIRSRCLILNVGAGEGNQFDMAQEEWILNFARTASEPKQGLLARYQLLGPVVNWLHHRHQFIKKQLEEESPLRKYDELEPSARERFKKELDASIEAEYRRERSEMLNLVQWWLRDVWLLTLGSPRSALSFPTAADFSISISSRVSPRAARENLSQIETTQGLLQTNVQEGLALEVGLLKLHL